MHSQAISAMGTVVTVEGRKLREVINAKIGRKVEIEANYLPGDETQESILRAAKRRAPLQVTIQLSDPSKTISRFDAVDPEAFISVDPHRQLVLSYSFDGRFPLPTLESKALTVNDLLERHRPGPNE